MFKQKSNKDTFSSLLCYIVNYQPDSVGGGRNKVNDLILKQLLAIILQTYLQSHQLFHSDRQNIQK